MISKLIRIKKLLNSFFLTALFLWNVPAWAEEIKWAHVDHPPMFINSGLYAGSGFADQQTKFMQQKLKDQQHIDVPSDFVTIMRHFVQKDDLCTFGIFKTRERENFLHYTSVPYGKLLPSGIIVEKQTQEKLSAFIEPDGSIDLNRILSETELRFGFNKGRRYSSVIDDFVLLNADYAPERFWNRELKPSDSKNFKLLKGGRIDITFGYPYEISFYNMVQGVQNDFIYIPVKGMPKFVDVYIACSKTDWGMKQVNLFNTVLFNKENLVSLEKFYLNWLGEEEQNLFHILTKKGL